MAIPQSRARTRKRASARQVSTASPKALARALRKELGGRLPVQDLVDSLGHVAAARRREAGELLTMRDHLEGLVLAMLRANRPWRRIAERLEELSFVFDRYRPSFLDEADPATLAAGVRELDCGNSRLRAQMEALAFNVATMRQIEARFGHMDAFVTQGDADTVAGMLSGARSEWKLKEVGRPVAMAYLENVGIGPSSADPHVERVLGADRLGILPAGPAAHDAFLAFAKAAGVHPVELVDWIRLFAAEEHAAICTDKPKCDECGLQKSCGFQRSRRGRSRS